MARESKQCEQCGREFFKNPRNGNAAWERRRFCGNPCRLQFDSTRSVIDGVEHKRCSKCERILPTDNFYKGSAWCKECMKVHRDPERRREAYRKYNDKTKDKRKANYYENRERISEERRQKRAEGRAQTPLPPKKTEEQKREARRAYYLANKERIAERGRIYQKENAEHIRAAKKAYYEQNKELFIKKQKEWREANRDRYLAYHEQYRTVNKEKVSKGKKDWAERNRGRLTERSRRYAAENRERLSAYNKQWRVLNKEITLYHSRLRRARKNQAPGSFTLKQFLAKCAYHGWRCYLCGKEVAVGNMHAEHRKPLSRGGSNWKANIAPACPTCNSSKKDKTEAEFRAWRARMAA